MTLSELLGCVKPIILVFSPCFDRKTIQTFNLHNIEVLKIVPIQKLTTPRP